MSSVRLPGCASFLVDNKRNTFPPTFTIAVLLYGDYQFLAERCLSAILRLPNPSKWELRIGMNAVSENTRRYVEQIFNQQAAAGSCIRLYDSTTNRGKYPLMRWMLHDPINRVGSPYVMWFDDDSFIQTPTEDWLCRLEEVMSTADMCGQVLTTSMIGNQHLWLRMQPWFNGKDPVQRSKNLYSVPHFAVGGWWVLRTNVLNKLDWPPPNIIHLGGDYMLGEALRQHDYRLRDYRVGVIINADDSGKDASAQRRGNVHTVHCGADYSPSVTAALHINTQSVPLALLDYPGI